MHFCLFFLLAISFICQISASLNKIEKKVQDYFDSESVKKLRKEWENHRRPIEHAIITALKEHVGLEGMNVYVRKLKEKLADGYLHNDNQVRLILHDLELEDLPHFWLPEVQFSLASNVIKIQTKLSKMIIHADYALIRNKTHIIYEPKDQDPYKSSPFLFQQVQDAGKVAITIDRCTLSGFMITTLSGHSVNIRYEQFSIMNCVFNFEIYRPGEDSPPVIAKYIPYRKDECGLGLTHLLLKPLTQEELVPKLRTALFSLVNTSAIFGTALQEFRENQEIVFQATANYLTELVRNLNRITIEKNNGAIDMEDYVVHWDDGKVKHRSHDHKNSTDESLKLLDMVLTGLDSMYSAHVGGPFKMDSVLIAEEIRFSSLQVRGKLEVKTMWSDTFGFAAEICDMAVDLHLGQSQVEDGKPANKNYGLKKLEVKGFRRMTFTVPSLIFGSAESMIGGYLLNVVPKLIQRHLRAIFPEAYPPTKKASPSTKPLSLLSGNLNMDGDDIYDSSVLDDVYDDLHQEKIREEPKIKNKKLDKLKKRFKSAKWLRHRSGRHVTSNNVYAANNKIRK